MPVLKPCSSCGRNNKACPIKEATAAALENTGVTHATFKCSLWRGDFLPGERVNALVWDLCEEDGPYQDYRGGTVLRIERGKYLIQLDDPVISRRGGEEAEVFTQRAAHKNIRLLDEAPRHLCKCGYVKQEGDEQCHTEGLKGLFCSKEWGELKDVSAAVAIANRSENEQKE